MFLRAGEKLTWYPSKRKARIKQIQTDVVPFRLTSCVGKLMERLVNTRLVRHMEKSIITSERAGFRQYRSAEDQVTYIAQKIEDGFQDKQHTLTVWIDMQQAYKVWKVWLRIKLQRSGVTGCMYQWISQYLTKRKARVHVDKTYNCNKTLREGVPQGGVLSPTLFLVFINDSVRDMPRKVLGAIHADNLILWNTLQLQAIDCSSCWTSWKVGQNSGLLESTPERPPLLSSSFQKANLYINGQALFAEDSLTYLAVTFNKRLTWKQQSEKAEARAKVRLALRKKLAGTALGADAVTLRRLHG